MNAFIFDIDSLLTFDRKVWIVDRINPSIPILRIDESEFNLIKSDIYMSLNNKLYFNGRSYYVSNELLDRIKVKSKTEKFNLSNISFSMREYLDPTIIDNLKPIIDITPILKLRNLVGDTYLISSKFMKGKYDKHIDLLRDELIGEGFKIKGIYFLDKAFHNFEEDKNIYKKELIIASHLFGRKIKDSKLTDEEYPKYESIYYFDSSEECIEDLKDIKVVINKLSKDYKFEDSALFLNKITSNKINRLIETKIIL
jgi:hypothetical protein